MKKIILVIVIILSTIGFASCNLFSKEPNYKERDLKYLIASKNEEKQKYNSSDEFKNHIYLVNEFATDISEKTFSKYYQKYDRLAISPISIYMALAMATGIAEKEARTELENLLGIPYDQILEYTKYLHSRLNQEFLDGRKKLSFKIQLQNSLWINDTLQYKKEGVDLLKDSFYTDSYYAPFTRNNKAANNAVKDYVFRNTKGLINYDYNFDVDTLFLLINTLYLKDTWNSKGSELSLTSSTYDFINQNNTTTKTKLLVGYYSDGKIQQEDGFEYFHSMTSNGVVIHFIKPTTKTLNEIFNSDNLSKIINDKNYDYVNDELKEEYHTRCLFPEFNATFNEDIVNILKEEYGLTEIFKENKANFNQLTDEDTFVKNIIHQVKLDVNKRGIEGAAVTVMPGAGSSAPREEYKKVYLDFIIDQSFGFIITRSDVVLFSGVVNNL